MRRGAAPTLCRFEAGSAGQHRVFQALFDRATDYREIMATLAAFPRKLAKLDEPTARRSLETLRRELAQIIGSDFFPGPSRQQAEGALADADSALATRFSPNEPHAAHRKIPRRKPSDYRGRTWATRERLWIDRVCSAWLIRRFIDPKRSSSGLNALRIVQKRRLDLILTEPSSVTSMPRSPSRC